MGCHRELEEPFAVQDIHVEGLWSIQRLAGDNRRFLFYTDWHSRPVGVVNIIMPRVSVLPAMRMTALDQCMSLGGDPALWMDFH